MNLMRASSVFALLTLTHATSFAQFIKVSPPSVNVPKITPPNIDVPKITPPNINGPKINGPRIDVPKINGGTITGGKINIPDPLAEARKQAARVEELRRQAERVVKDFYRMRDEFEKNRADMQKLANQAQRGELDAVEARRRLLAAGGYKTNKSEISKGIDQGLGVVVWGKEFDHLEQQKCAAAVASSVATANPGPAMAYLKYFAVATKAEVMKNIKHLPAQAQRKAEAEFEMLLIRGLNSALQGRRPSGLNVEHVRLTIALATYNHWVEVKMNQPRLIPTEKILGVQLYRVGTDPVTIKAPLPNTFKPYVKLVVQGSR